MLSTKNFGQANKINDTTNIRLGYDFVVSSEHAHERIRAAIKEKGWTYRKVAQMSKGRLSATTVSDVFNNKVQNVKTETLTAFAEALGIPLADLLPKKHSREDLEQSRFAILYNKNQRLNPSSRKAIERLLDVVEREIDLLTEKEQ